MSKLFLALFFFSINFTLPQNIILNKGGGSIPSIICGNDDRISATNAAIGRIIGYNAQGEPVQIGTGFIAQNGKILSAQHVYISNLPRWEIEFNVPNSDPGGNIVHPSPENIYTINTATHYLGGDDTWIFDVELNIVTGEHPLKKQGSSLAVVLNGEAGVNSFATVYGYSTNPGLESNYTLQRATGQITWKGSAQYMIEYDTDTEAGASGGPVLVNGLVVAIHRGSLNNACPNVGAFLSSNDFAIHFNSPFTYKNTRLDQTNYNSTIFTGVLKRWWNDNYLSYTSSKSLLLKPGSDIVLHADSNLINGYKFKHFNNSEYNRIYSGTMPPEDTDYKSRLVDVKNNIFMRNSFESDGELNGGFIQFKDPWFAANANPYLLLSYGYSNLGLNAVFHSRPSPFNPKSSGSDIGSYYKVYWFTVKWNFVS